jgi:hypothetical protein
MLLGAGHFSIAIRIRRVALINKVTVATHETDLRDNGMSIRDSLSRVLSPVVSSRWALRTSVLRALFLLASIVTISAVNAADDGATRLTANPTSIQSLLSNIKVALADGLFLSPSFYSEENLRAFSGAQKIRWLSNTSITKYVDLRGADYIPMRYSSSAILGGSWLVRTRPGDSAAAPSKILATFTIQCRCRLRIEDIEDVFGTSGRTVDEDRRLAGTHYPRPPKPASPMGNQVVTYEIATKAPYRSTFAVTFDSDGNVELIDARQRET